MVSRSSAWTTGSSPAGTKLGAIVSSIVSAPRSTAGQFLAQHFQLQPLLLGGADARLQFADRRGGFFEAGAVARVELRIVEFRLQLAHILLQRRDCLRQRLQRVLVLEGHASLAGGWLARTGPRRLRRAPLFPLQLLPGQIGAALRQHIAVAA